MPRQGLDRDAVVRAACVLVDACSLPKLSMAALAKQLDIAIPSLYAHVRNLEHLRELIANLATNELADVLGPAVEGRHRGDALRALAHGYRTYGHRYPGRYAASQLPPATTIEAQTAVARVAQPIYATLCSYGLAEPGLTDAVRCLRSALHGFITLEQVQGFTHRRSVNRSFEVMLEFLDHGFSSWPANTGTTADHPFTS